VRNRLFYLEAKGLEAKCSTGQGVSECKIFLKIAFLVCQFRDNIPCTGVIW
jgi:hypothetical protein